MCSKMTWGIIVFPKCTLRCLVILLLFKYFLNQGLELALVNGAPISLGLKCSHKESDFASFCQLWANSVRKKKSGKMVLTKTWHYALRLSTKMPIHDQWMLIKLDEWVDPRGNFIAQIQKHCPFVEICTYGERLYSEFNSILTSYELVIIFCGLEDFIFLFCFIGLIFT